jgi:hypothetical protein
MEKHLKYDTALNAVTDTTVSDKFYVGGAKRIALLFRRADNAGGSSAFTVKESLDEIGTVTPTMTAFNMLIDNVVNANTLNLTRVNGVTIGAVNADAFLWVDPNCLVTWLEITVTETTSGTHSAWIICEY